MDKSIGQRAWCRGQSVAFPLCGSGFGSAESFDPESFELELTTEGLAAGQPQLKWNLII